jgi:hypothetical protein
MNVRTCALVAVTFLGTATYVAANSPDNDRMVIDLESRATRINNFVDLGPPGPSPGDLYVWVDNLFLPGSTRDVGDAVGRCTLIDPAIGSFGCTTVSSINGSTLTTEGILYNVPGVVSVGSITGGTGRYRGASGEGSVDLGPPSGPHRVRFTLLK